MGKKGRTEHLYGLTLEASLLIVRTLRDAGRLAPLPYLQEAAKLAIVILEIIQDMSDAKEGFKQLASDACGLVYAVIKAQQTGTAVSQDMRDNILDLISQLQSIKALVEKELRRGYLQRAIQHSSDKGKIQKYREALRQLLDVFGLQSNISIRINITRLIDNQSELLQQIKEQKSLLMEVRDQQLAENTHHTLPDAPRLKAPPLKSLNPYLSMIAASEIPQLHPKHYPQDLHHKHAVRPLFPYQSSSPTYIENHNSGNTNITNISNSHNNSSVRNFGSRAQQREW